MSKRSTILTAIKSTLAAEVAGLDADRIHLGVIPLQRLTGDPHVGLMSVSDVGERAEGTVDREMTLVIGAVIGVDPSAAESQVEQLWATFDEIHAAMERIADDVGAVGAAFISESQAGVESGGLDDADNVAYAAGTWTINYCRDHGAA